MDEFLPPFIRNSYWFMYPFYFVAYRGKNIKEKMNYKSLVKKFTNEQYNAFYARLNSISRNRRSDLSESNISFIFKNIGHDTKNILDVGCGRGYLLQKIKSVYPEIEVAGMDVVNILDDDQISFFEANITNTGFKDDQFETVICTHTIEHLLNLQLCINELVRITRKKLIIVTPCQRYFYYTLDEHINFFHKKEMLLSLFPFTSFICKKINFDWVYIGYK
ncbi:MAG: class I SAM-dependent methyltransferase [Ginsengibacter sp.]